jgi:hypothetical protein
VDWVVPPGGCEAPAPVFLAPVAFVLFDPGL